MTTKHDSIYRRVGVGEAAERLGVHPETLRRWEAAGRITSTRTPGNQRRYLVTDVEELATGGDPTTATDSAGSDRKAAS